MFRTLSQIHIQDFKEFLYWYIYKIVIQRYTFLMAIPSLMEQYGKLVESRGCLLLSMKENKSNNIKLNNSLMEHIFISQRYLNIVFISIK